MGRIVICLGLVVILGFFEMSDGNKGHNTNFSKIKCYVPDGANGAIP